MEMNLFTKGARRQASPLTLLVKQMQDTTRRSGTGGFVEQAVAKDTISMESLNDLQGRNLESAITGLSAAMEGWIASSKMTNIIGSQKLAGVGAGMIGSAMGAFLSLPTEGTPGSLNDKNTFVPSSNGVPRLSQALEAYSEEANKNAAVYTVAYNMQASRQDEFGETLYPTVVVSPDQIGYLVSVQLVTVYEEVRRNISGAVDDFGRRNIIQAVRDASILDNSHTEIVPVVRPESAANFVDPALVAPVNVLVGRESVPTAPLKFGQAFSLLGLSQTDSLVSQGLMDSTDSIDPDIRLKALYLDLVDGADHEVVKFNVENVPRSQFNDPVQGRDREMALNFTTDALKIDANTKLANGADSDILDPVTVGDYVVRLSVQVFGKTDLQIATTEVNASPVKVASITNAAGQQVALNDPSVAPIIAIFAASKLIGYELRARRSNANRRQRGQLLDTYMFNQLYAVPLLSPITVPRPLGQGDATDASDLAALVTATRIRASNAAVTELLRAAAVLRDFYASRDAIGRTPEILGVATKLVNPFYEFRDIDLQQIVDSVKSHERHSDIRGALVNIVREVMYRAYRESNYKGAADALNGGLAPHPMIIIATDQVLAQWLMVEGDFRTIGNEFNVKVVATQDSRMDGKMFATFGVTGGTDGAPNPLHFGNMAWKPELTLVLPLHRNGANSKELTVQPAFRHITNLPILVEYRVRGITELVTNKVISFWDEK